MVTITGSNLTIMVKDMDRSIKFYESIGLVLQQRWGDHYAMMGANGITLGIHPSKDENLSSGTVSVGFMIDNLQQAYELLVKNKIAYTVAEDPNAGTIVSFFDPDKTGIYFILPAW